MNPRERVYKTTSIDLATFLAVLAYIVTATKPSDGDNRAVFEIEQKPELFQDIAAYESGATAPAKRLLNIRSRLFREASAVVRGCRS